MGMNSRVANLTSELVPVKNAAMLEALTFAAASFDRDCTHVDVTVKGGATMTTDGRDPAGVGAIVHILPDGANFTWRKEKFLACRFGGSGTLVVSQMTL
jgi:hypothetical protein